MKIIKYLGSKNRISKYIVPILQDCIDKNNVKTYYEPFVGGCNVIDKIKCERRIGNDIHKELIAMWIALRGGWNPPEHISEEEYIRVRDYKDQYPDYYVGYVGFHAVFGSRYFEGYARGFKNDGVTPRDMSNESYRNTMKQVPNIKDVIFTCGDYLNNEYSYIQDAVIYCDPPYCGTEKYRHCEINYGQFWDWCKERSKDNFVFISEYNAPDDFKCIWGKETIVNFDSNRDDDKQKKKRVEKLFVYKAMRGGYES